MRARKLIVAALCLSLGACVENHFAYVTDIGHRPDGQTAQQLRLAQITDPSPPTGPAATGIATLMDTATPDGDGLSSIHGLWVSPGNLRLAAHVDMMGPDFLDRNLNAWNVSGGAQLSPVNELTVIPIIHRSTCPSAAFNAYLAHLAAQGTPQSELNAMDFVVPTASPSDVINLPEPQVLGWVDDMHLALSWTFPFYTTPDHAPLQDTFLVIVTWPLNGAAPTVACTSQPPTIPHPPTALSADPVIRLNGYPVKWTQQGQPIPAPPAQFIAGVIAP